MKTTLDIFQNPITILFSYRVISRERGMPIEYEVDPAEVSVVDAFLERETEPTPLWLREIIAEELMTNQRVQDEVLEDDRCLL